VEAVIFGDATSNLAKAGGLVGIGLFFAVVVYLLMVYPSMRREQFKTLEGCSKRAAGCVVATILAACAATSYWIYLAPFFEVELSDTHLSVRYQYPTRTLVLHREQIERLGRRVEPTKSGVRVSLLVYVRDGRVLESAEQKPEAFESAYTQLEAWLRRKPAE
jgi:hypothetical protein